MPMFQAFGCSNKVSEQKDKKFFPIPNPEKDRARCGAWLHAIETDRHSLSSYKFSKHKVVCEDHFEKHCFMRDFEAEMGFRLPRKRLKPDAVPTVFVHRQMATTSRASSVRRSADGESSEMLSNLLDPPEDAPAEASEVEATFHFVESSSIPSVNARLSNRASSSSKEIATQTDLGHLVSSSTQTDSPEYYDGEAQEPPVQTDAPPDHSYCATEKEKDEEMRDILSPVINNAFKKQQESLLGDYLEKEAKFSGGGRCDSPGYKAKYCTYSLMNTETEKIIISEHVQVTETTS
ncbi:hypothetical protein BSL78_01706 [Apostichopus japonicus]|uniref:THAP-type domain-containing protein n=1 Tax=Stichopus japonicus TaxID=307972 RepID=A0A2G8LM56_STIJA|nr:hypothetical protein BSL78_01706 [Apostichopus japonicus]